MRLVRGSILSSEACSTSRAAHLLRRFLRSDEGTDVSVKSFLSSAARSLEAMGQGPHSSLKKSKKKKRRSELETTTDFEKPNEGLSASGYEPQTQASACISTVLEYGKHSKKREKTSNFFVEGHPNDEEEVCATQQKTDDNKHGKGSKKKHTLQDAEAGRPEKVDYDSYNTPTVQKKSEKVRRANGAYSDAVVASTSAALNQYGTEISGETEKKKRKKDRKHQHNEDHDGGLINLQERTNLEFEEAPSTHKKKSRKLRSPDQLDEANANNNLVFSSSRKSEQRKHFVNEGDFDHNRKVAETATEEQQSHSTKKKKKHKTP